LEFSRRVVELGSQRFNFALQQFRHLEFRRRRFLRIPARLDAFIQNAPIFGSLVSNGSHLTEIFGESAIYI